MHEAVGFASLISQDEMGKLFKYFVRRKSGIFGYLLLVCIIKRGNMEFHTPSSGREKMTPDTHSRTHTHKHNDKNPPTLRHIHSCTEKDNALKCKCN